MTAAFLCLCKESTELGNDARKVERFNPSQPEGRGEGQGGRSPVHSEGALRQFLSLAGWGWSQTWSQAKRRGRHKPDCKGPGRSRKWAEEVGRGQPLKGLTWRRMLEGQAQVPSKGQLLNALSPLWPFSAVQVSKAEGHSPWYLHPLYTSHHELGIFCSRDLSLSLGLMPAPSAPSSFSREGPLQTPFTVGGPRGN